MFCLETKTAEVLLSLAFSQWSHRFQQMLRQCLIIAEYLLLELLKLETKFFGLLDMLTQPSSSFSTSIKSRPFGH